ncbi:MAG: hypothetical protein H7837_10890 [Magnetococcus sp. MYC-9]
MADIKVVTFSGSPLKGSGTERIQIPIEVEAHSPVPGFTPVSDTGGHPSYEEAIDRVRPVADYLLQKIQDLDARPDSVEVTFGIKLSAQAGALIAKTGAEANFGVKLVWNRDKSS